VADRVKEGVMITPKELGFEVYSVFISTAWKVLNRKVK
jgi:hypothetical protein